MRQHSKHPSKIAVRRGARHVQPPPNAPAWPHKPDRLGCCGGPGTPGRLGPQPGAGTARLAAALCRAQRHHFGGRLGQYGMAAQQLVHRHVKHHRAQTRWDMGSSRAAHQHPEARAHAGVQRHDLAARQENSAGLAGDVEQRQFSWRGRQKERQFQQLCGRHQREQHRQWCQFNEGAAKRTPDRVSELRQ